MIFLGGGGSGPPVPPLDPPMKLSMAVCICMMAACLAVKIAKYLILAGGGYHIFSEVFFFFK